LDHSKAWVLDVGNCQPDHSSIRNMLEKNFDVSLDRVMFVDEAVEKMRSRKYDLVLVNRLIFDDSSEGIDLLHRAKTDPALADAPIMMLSNYKEAQAAATAAGAEPGFGKAALGEPTVVELLGHYLPRKGAAAATVR
jgi:CheY-like chemotaxis protein